MADEEKTPKKSPMKMLLPVVAVVILGGGFFALKGSPKQAEAAGPELGETASLGEILVNLDRNQFLQTTLVVQLDKNAENPFGAEGGHGAGQEGVGTIAARDAVFGVLAGRPVSDLTDPVKKAALRRALADAINDSLHKLHGSTDDKESQDKKPEPNTPVDESFDSQEGPVLKVFFKDLAWQ